LAFHELAKHSAQMITTVAVGQHSYDTANGRSRKVNRRGWGRRGG
jgi:hypothetical protein